MLFTPMRPTFEMQLPFSKEEVIRRIGVELKKPNRSNTCLLFDQYAELHIPESDIRYWSPHLSLSFDGDSVHTRVQGRFAPRQEVWTLVWVIYLILAFSAFFASVFECAFWMMGQSSWFGLAAILALVGIGALYLMSQIGQMLSADQMMALKSDWQRLVEGAFPFANSAFENEDQDSQS